MVRETRGQSKLALSIEARAPTYREDCLRSRRAIRAVKPILPTNWWRPTLTVLRCLDRSAKGWRLSRFDLEAMNGFQAGPPWQSERVNAAIRVVVAGAQCISQPSRSPDLAAEAERIVAEITQEVRSDG